MSGISAGTGLISGLDTGSLIDQLMQIEARPRTRLQQRVQILESQKSAFLDINAKLLGLETSANNFLDEDSFGQKTATSSRPSILKASADANAPLGSFQFSVSRLVSTHQLITRGFTDDDAATLGQAATITVESADARLDRETELSQLNGFEGVQRGRIRITDRSGASADIDLSRAVTVDDALREINNAAGIAVTASIDRDRLVIEDNTGQAVGDLVVANRGNTRTATDLGIAGASAGTDAITGQQINLISGLTPLSALNDGLGVRARGGGLTDFQVSDGTSAFDVKLGDAQSVQAVLDAINNAAGNTSVVASIGDDGVGLKLEGAGPLSVAAVGGSRAAADLGLEGSGGAVYDGDRVLAAMNSKLIRNLSGAAGLNIGTVSFDTGSGPQAVDLAAARSFSELVDAINEAGVGVTASINNAGNGVEVASDNGAPLTIADDSGNLADTLNLAGAFADGVADSGDLDVTYLSENTRLDDLNAGAGVAAGKFTIIDSAGARATVDLTQGESTVQQVIKEINSRPVGVTASINETGDGILLTDTAGGAGSLAVEEEDGGTTAADLGILGTDDDGDGRIDGSFERTVEIEADDTLTDLADKLNAADVGLSATVINDGTAAAPFRISITSESTGRAGRLLFDDGGLDLGAQTLVEGRNAVAFFGSADPAEGVLLTSSTNTLNDTIEGVSIDLLGAGDEVVNLNVGRNSESVVDSVGKFVNDFNGLMTRINQLDSYDEETQERGLLLGDPTLAVVRRQMLNVVTRQFNDVSGEFTRLSEVGITIGSDAQLEFDEATLRDAMARDLSAVQQLFSLKTQAQAEEEQIAPGVTVGGGGIETTARGVGAYLQDILDALTDSVTGTLTRKANSLDSQIDLTNDQVDSVNLRLENERARLERQFAAMENTLAQLQSQQSALSSLANLAANPLQSL